MALIYIVEDDDNIREIEEFALRNSGYRVSGFTGGAELYEALAAELPDLIVLDIMLPDEDGLEILKKLRENGATADLPIMFVTAKTTEMDMVKGLDQGADDYITKPFGVMELIARVKALLRRSEALKPKELKLGPIRVEVEKHRVFVEERVCELTHKEYELLKLLLEQAGKAVTRETILDRVWGIGFEGESRTLDMHIKTLRRKLGSAGTMIRTLRYVGFCMEEGEIE